MSAHRSEEIVMAQDPSTYTAVVETDEPAVVAEDVLVEEVSIDGMCGVY
jgi:mycofactocin precursor